MSAVSQGGAVGQGGGRQEPPRGREQAYVQGRERGSVVSFRSGQIQWPSVKGKGLLGLGPPPAPTRMDLPGSNSASRYSSFSCVFFSFWLREVKRQGQRQPGEHELAREDQS